MNIKFALAKMDRTLGYLMISAVEDEKH